MDESVNLVVFPGVQEGHDEAVVKKKLARTLNVDLEKVEAWFLKEKPTTILKDIDAVVAERYVTAIMKCGGAVQYSSRRQRTPFVSPEKCKYGYNPFRLSVM